MIVEVELEPGNPDSVIEVEVPDDASDADIKSSIQRTVAGIRQTNIGQQDIGQPDAPLEVTPLTEEVAAEAQRIREEGFVPPLGSPDIPIIPSLGINIPGSLIEALTGAGAKKQTPELATLPETANIFNQDMFDITTPEGASTAAAFMVTTDPIVLRDIIKTNIPEAEFETTPEGSTIVSLPDKEGNIRRSVLNRPGISTKDFSDIISNMIAFLPAQRAVAIGKTLATKAAIGGLTGAGTEAALQAGEAAAGSKQGIKGEEIAVAGALGFGTEFLAPIIRGIRDFIKSSPDPKVQEIIQAGIDFKVPVKTSDVIPPDSFLAKTIRTISDKTSFLGTAGGRRQQQVARENATLDLMDELGVISVNDDFGPQVVESLSKKQANNLVKAEVKREIVVDKLTPFGQVSTPNATREIDSQIAQQLKLGSKGDQGLINRLEDTKSALVGDFRQVKDIRSQVIHDVKSSQTIGESIKGREESIWQAVKSSIDKDMVKFARDGQKALKEKTLVRDYLASNREFAFEIGKSSDDVLKQLLRDGTAAPSKVMPLLKSGDSTKLKKLKNGLTQKGINNANSAFVKDILDTSGYFNNVNPDRIATLLLKPKNQRYMNIFMDGADKKQIEGFSRLLDSTRQAQQAPVLTQTGQQDFALSLLTSFKNLLLASTTGVATRIYESKPMRNILIRLGNTKPGSKEETALLNSLRPALQGGLQAARDQRASEKSQQKIINQQREQESAQLIQSQQ